MKKFINRLGYLELKDMGLVNLLIAQKLMSIEVRDSKKITQIDIQYDDNVQLFFYTIFSKNGDHDISFYKKRAPKKEFKKLFITLFQMNIKLDKLTTYIPELINARSTFPPY